MDLLMQYLVTGLTVGSIYALLAIGFVTIYNITGILNFAQGEFAMIGALTCITLVNTGLPMFASILLAILITAVIGFIVERTAILHARNKSVIILIIITIGLSTFLKGLGLIVWGSNPKQLAPIFQTKPIQFMGAVINPQSIFIFIVLFILLAALYVFFEKTYIGSALRASEKNPRAAKLMGINTSTMSALAFTLAAALGAIAGIMIAPITDATYEMGFLIGVKGFVGMVIGGMHSIPGAVAGALIVGLLETFSGAFVSTFYSDAITFTVLILVLFLKPNGIFARASGERV
ncbi:branched-chain amino acid ABC transporter permease [Bacillus sp. AFS076308]|uniref:branched-chain amino acid ABC transporter permease n=1 Tax=unclassified Bacillus (in: firmicutes) TaxID=185979 RepID=UPI000BF2E02A|nr:MULTISPECIES: branched-chain amino acid ABC transporter permease [unclassified Bacillus (in: firmicutes)]PFO06855.1 branched-chain amino acid ABC transporter permease [Bacillus sp. AFS076308]PGV55306.1 branched-chain amino acid ABC transporter permease [Bacillus sp. AFS037270]